MGALTQRNILRRTYSAKLFALASLMLGLAMRSSSSIFVGPLCGYAKSRMYTGVGGDLRRCDGHQLPIRSGQSKYIHERRSKEAAGA